LDRQVELPVLSSQEELPVLDSQEELLVLDSQEDLLLLDSQEQLPVLDSHKELPVLDSQEELPVLDSHQELPILDSLGDFSRLCWTAKEMSLNCTGQPGKFLPAALGSQGIFSFFTRTLSCWRTLLSLSTRPLQAHSFVASTPVKLFFSTPGDFFKLFFVYT
jgi:hypothetical protein